MENNKGIILVADDDEHVREFLRYFLETDFPDYSIEEYKNGDTLKNRLEDVVGKDNVKLLITDNDMKSGLTGIKLIREYSARVNFPIVLHYGGPDTIGKEAVESGAFGYLRKPCHFEELNNLVRAALGEKIHSRNT